MPDIEDDEDPDDLYLPEFPYPIDEHLVVPMKAKTSAMKAKDEHNLVIGSRNYDFSNPISVQAFFDELGEDAVRPVDDGVYIMFWIKTDAENEPVPFMKPLDEAQSFLQGLAARDSVTTAQAFADRAGFLPLHDPLGKN